MNPSYRNIPELTGKPSASIGDFPKRGPIPKRRKKPRRAQIKDSRYLAYIRSLGCIVCRESVPHNSQSSRTEAAHVGERGLGQKCSDQDTIPLCSYHHRIGPTSHHVAGKRFWEIHRLDRDRTIAALRAVYEIGWEESE